VDYQLFYTQKALSDLAEIIGYIAEDDTEAASRFGNSLLDHVELLARYPRIGGIIRKRSQVRKLVHSPVLVYYQIHEDERLIEVLHFRHASRRPGI
jgi:plasmid stabilization system protein ParE